MRRGLCVCLSARSQPELLVKPLTEIRGVKTPYHSPESFSRTHENWYSSIVQSNTQTRIIRLPAVYARKPNIIIRHRTTSLEMSDHASDVSTSSPTAKRSVSSRLPVLRKPSGAQASKQNTSGEVAPRGAAHPPSATPKAATIVKRTASLRPVNSTNGSATRPGNTIGTTRAAELRRVSAAKYDPLASTPEEGAPGKFFYFIQF